MKILAGLTSCVLAFVSLVCVGSPPKARPSSQTTRFPSARTQKDGEQWLLWDALERKGFISGYLSGYKSGHNEGCGQAITYLVSQAPASKGPDPRAFCENAQLAFSEDKAHYIKTITEFYNTYANDREIPLPMMMWLLSDQQNKNPTQIHEWYVSGGNRTSR